MVVDTGFGRQTPREGEGEGLSPAGGYADLLAVVEACVVVAGVGGRVDENRVAADEAEALDLNSANSRADW